MLYTLTAALKGYMNNFGIIISKVQKQIIFLRQRKKILPRFVKKFPVWVIFISVNYPSVFCIFFVNKQILAEITSLLISLETQWTPPKCPEPGDPCGCRGGMGTCAAATSAPLGFFPRPHLFLSNLPVCPWQRHGSSLTSPLQAVSQLAANVTHIYKTEIWSYFYLLKRKFKKKMCLYFKVLLNMIWTLTHCLKPKLFTSPYMDRCKFWIITLWWCPFGTWQWSHYISCLSIRETFPVYLNHNF